MHVFFRAGDNFIPSLLILIAVIGSVVYTMGGAGFAGWSALRYSTLSCLLGTITAMAIVAAMTLFGYVSVPSVEVVRATAPHLLFMTIFPGVIALVGWNLAEETF